MGRAIPGHSIITIWWIADVEIKDADAQMSTPSNQPLRRRADHLESRLEKISFHDGGHPLEGCMQSKAPTCPGIIFATIINDGD